MSLLILFNQSPNKFASSTATAGSTAAGSLTTGIRLAANTLGVSTSAAQLQTAIRLNTAAVGNAMATAGLSTSILVSGNAFGNALSSASLNTVIYAGSATAGTSTVLGALTTSILINAAAIGNATATAALTSNAAQFAASTVSVSTASSGLVTLIRLSASAQGIASSSALLNTVIYAGSATAGASTATGALTTAILVSAATSATAATTGALALNALLSAAAIGRAAGSASLSTTIFLNATPVCLAVSAGSLITPILLSAAVGTPSRGDVHYRNVVALIHAEGPDPSTSIIDNSFAPKTYTASGDAVISAVKRKFGGTSLKFQGGGAIRAGVSSDFAFPQDFTIEFFANKVADGPQSSDIVFSVDTSSGSAINGYFVELSVSRGFLFAYAGGVVVSASGIVINDGLFHHWAVCRSGTSIRLFRDGEIVGTTGSTASYLADGVATIGSTDVGTSYRFNGFIDDLRITKNVARYTTTFTPPDQAFPDAVTPDALYSSVNVLHNFTDDLTDARGHTTTASGTTAFDTTDYSGGSLKLASTDGYLRVDGIAPFGTGDFTVEAYVLQNRSLAADPGVFQISTAASGLQPSYSNAVTLYQSTGTGAAKHTLNLGSAGLINEPYLSGLNHIAAERFNGETRLYINGVSTSSLPDTQNYTGTTLAIGGYYSSAFLTSGNLRGFRITANAARYKGNFVPLPLPYEKTTGGFTATGLLTSSIVNNFASATAGASIATGVLSTAILVRASAASTSSTSVALTTSIFLQSASSYIAGDQDFGNVSLLLHAEGLNLSTTVSDSSLSTKTCTSINSAVISDAQFKFGDKSLYLNSGAYVSVTPSSDFQFGTGDFTLETWAYPISFAAAGRPVYIGDGLIGIAQMYITTSGALGVETNNANGGAGGSIALNAWSHLAITRTAGICRSFINGVQVYTHNDASNLANPSTVFIGAYANGNFTFQGYLDEVRITKGVSRYSANFVSPTQAFAGSVVLGQGATATATFAAATAQFAADLSAISVVTGALTTSIRVSSYALSSATATSALTSNSAQLSAAVLGVASSSASLNTVIYAGSAVNGASVASGALTTSITVAASSAAVTTATSSLTVGVRLAAASISVASATGTMNIGAVFAVNALSSASAAAVLTTSIALAASSVATSSATSALVVGVRLAAASVSQATATGVLNTVIYAGSAVAGASVAAGSLSTTIQAAGALTDVATASAALTTAITLAAAAQAVAATSASLTTVSLLLANTATAVATSTAALTTGVRLSASAQAVSAATATFNALVAQLVAASSASSTSSAILTTGIRPVAAATANGTASAALTTSINAASTALGSASASAALLTSITLAAASASASAVTAAVTVPKNLAAAVQAISSIQAQATTSIRLAAQVIAEAQASSRFFIQTDLSPVRRVYSPVGSRRVAAFVETYRVVASVTNNDSTSPSKISRVVSRSDITH